jgi:GxxExxY protein
MAEEIYQQSLEIELGIRMLSFVSKAAIRVFYKNMQLETMYVPDLLAFGEIVIELKAVAELCSDHEAQLFNYMRIARKRVGYLVNYGKAGGLEWKRFVLDDLKDRKTLGIVPK